MQASFTLTEGEYVKANQLFTKPSRKTLFIYAVAGIALATIALGAGSPALRIGAIGALVGGIFGHLFVRRIYAPSQTRKQYKACKAAQEPVCVTRQDDGINFETASGGATIEWARIVKWRENDELLLIYQAPQVYHIVPKRIGELADEISMALDEELGAAT